MTARTTTRRWAMATALTLAMGAVAGCDEGRGESGDEPPAGPPAPTVGVQVAGSLAHDTAAFTQGLVFHRGALYESTGQYGQSSLRRLDPQTGEVQQRVAVEDEYFAEGLAALGDRLFQLTWQNRVGFIYDVATLQRTATFGYTGEGWGLTTDGTSLILSDGTETIRFLDPQAFGVTRTIDVTDAGGYVSNLNELEWVRGEIWANVWKEDRIARIDPATGRVRGWIDISGLLPAGQRMNQEAVANGIAFDEATGTLWLTGKLWPTIFRVTIPDLPAAGGAAAKPTDGGPAP